MEQLADKFYESLILSQYQHNQHVIKQKVGPLDEGFCQFDLRDPEQYRKHLLTTMHHYLPKKIPQVKIKFYQYSKAANIEEKVEEEFQYAAEYFQAEEFQQYMSEQLNNKKTHLLDNDMETIFTNINNKKEQQERVRQVRIENELKKQREFEDDMGLEFDDNGDIINHKDMESKLESKQRHQINQLWIDKYTSQKFFELLTDEATNRNVLTWIKTWDEVVYPEAPIVNLKVPLSMQKQYVHSGLQAVNGVPQRAPTHHFVQHQDQFSFKNKKVLLLYGPPGTGKSTMARVLAKHCGYNITEVNASDERTGDRLLEKIKSATQMNSHFSKAAPSPVNGGNQDDKQKPVCLIVDEVDGAVGSGGSLDGQKGVGKIVEYLKKCINYSENLAKKRNQADEDDEGDEDMKDQDDNDQEEGASKIAKKAGKKKKDDGIRELKRPIIFICNDLYSKALMPLRDIALCVKIEESNYERLLQRLRFICKKENFKVDDQILRELCEETRFDARSCINTLQFMAAQQRENGEKITVNQAVETCGKMTYGKDNFDNVFNIADELLFCKDRHIYTNNVKLLKEVRQKVQVLGDSQLLNDYLFHNYSSSVGYFDDDLEKTAYFLDTMSRAELNQSFIGRTQNYEMLSTQYIPAYTFRKFCAGVRISKNEFPKEVRNFRFERQKYKDTFDKLLDLSGGKSQRKGFRKLKENDVNNEERFKLDKNTSLQTGIRKRDFNTDILPFIYHMVHPNIREINTQLFTKHERIAFQQAIEIMIMFDITLKPESQDSLLDLSNYNADIAQFEPDLTSLVTFKGGHKQYMRNKTQILVLQNYESIKQRMLTSSNGQLGDYFETLKLKKSAAIEDTKLSGFGFLAGIAAQTQQNQKKRKLDQISGARSNQNNAENAISEQNQQQQQESTGRFTYKFKEGHSKNFKRELNFDYFTA
eukprot:403375550